MHFRKTTYKLYPSPKQAEGLRALLMQHKELWNAALEERVDAWRKFGKHISYYDQCKSLTQIRHELPDDWATPNAASQQVTLRRLDRAFRGFFDRCKSGQKPGFPRFKSSARMLGFGFVNHGKGWRFTPTTLEVSPSSLTSGERAPPRWGRHGTLRIPGIGHIRARGQSRVEGAIKSCELVRRKGPHGDEWHASVSIECSDGAVTRARTEHHAMAADWGVTRLLTVVRTDGAHGECREDVANPRWFQAIRERQVGLDRAVSSKRRGSKNWRKAVALRGSFIGKVKRRRHNRQHQLSARIAARCSVFATEALDLATLTRSAAGTAESPGSMVAQKSALNREILDTAPGGLFQKIAYKVPETGGLFLEAPTRALKPSQTCPSCGATEKKLLAVRWHCCAHCGHEEDRDSAAARVVLRWALGVLDIQNCGQELPEAV